MARVLAANAQPRHGLPPARAFSSGHRAPSRRQTEAFKCCLPLPVLSCKRRNPAACRSLQAYATLCSLALAG